MKKSKARVLMFDLECPYCSELLETSEGNGSLSFSINESCESLIKCWSCGQISKTPDTVRTERIVISRDISEDGE